MANPEGNREKSARYEADRGSAGSCSLVVALRFLWGRSDLSQSRRRDPLVIPLAQTLSSDHPGQINYRLTTGLLLPTRTVGLFREEILERCRHRLASAVYSSRSNGSIATESSRSKVQTFKVHDGPEMFRPSHRFPSTRLVALRTGRFVQSTLDLAHGRCAAYGQAELLAGKETN